MKKRPIDLCKNCKKSLKHHTKPDRFVKFIICKTEEMPHLDQLIGNPSKYTYVKMNGLDLVEYYEGKLDTE